MTEKLERTLPTVQKPARYVGGEYGQTMKDKRSVELRVAFCFPDTYEIGMSNLGMRILYAVMNRMDLYYQGDNIISYSAKTWWLTGFNPAYSNVSADDLSATYRIKFDDPWMFYAFSNEYRKTWLCDPSTRTIYYTLG